VLKDDLKPSTTNNLKDKWFELAKVKELNDKKAQMKEDEEFR
jgi:hypothetical protein